jgi:hypothetical protein
MGIDDQIREGIADASQPTNIQEELKRSREPEEEAGPTDEEVLSKSGYSQADDDWAVSHDSELEGLLEVPDSDVAIERNARVIQRLRQADDHKAKASQLERERAEDEAYASLDTQNEEAVKSAARELAESHPESLDEFLASVSGLYGDRVVQDWHEEQANTRAFLSNMQEQIDKMNDELDDQELEDEIAEAFDDAMAGIEGVEALAPVIEGIISNAPGIMANIESPEHARQVVSTLVRAAKEHNRSLAEANFKEAFRGESLSFQEGWNAGPNESRAEMSRRLNPVTPTVRPRRLVPSREAEETEVFKSNISKSDVDAEFERYRRGL